jgi:hypothetical protein
MRLFSPTWKTHFLRHTYTMMLHLVQEIGNNGNWNKNSTCVTKVTLAQQSKTCLLQLTNYCEQHVIQDQTKVDENDDGALKVSV